MQNLFLQKLIKQLLLLILITPLLSHSQYLKVSTNGSYLNVRKSFNTESEIINKLKDKTILVYDNDLRKGWIKIIADNGCWYDCVEGWVSSDYISSPNFKSNILNSINENGKFTNTFMSGELHYGDNSGIIENVDGILALQAEKHIYVNFKGNYVKLIQQNDANSSLKTYSNDKIDVSIFTMIERPGGDGTTWGGFMIIKYNEREEVIMITKRYSYLLGSEGQ